MNALQTIARPVNAPELPRNEMAFRARYQSLLLARRITTVFRPGARIHPEWRGYMVGERITARIIAQPGSDELGVAPVFNAVRIPIRIENLDVKGLQNLTKMDFAGSSPDVFDRASLLLHLEAIYGKRLWASGGEITRIAFAYED